MIIELLTTPIFALINGLISLLPSNYVIPSYISSTVSLLKVPLSVFPIDLWIIIISNVAFWYTVQISWAGIEWAYKKIPGVN